MRERGVGINLNKGLEQVNMTLADLPQLEFTDSVNPPRKGPCWKFLLGNCNGGEDCNFCHIPGDQIPDAYLKKVTPHLTNLVKNGLEKLDGPRKFSGTKRKRASGPNTVDLQE